MKNYFTLTELTRTDTGLSNEVDPTSVVMWNLGKLSQILNLIRYHVDCPIVVNSAFRSRDVNIAVGGVANSLHLQGRAADITCSSMSRLRAICRKWHESGILFECIEYDNFIHIAI